MQPDKKIINDFKAGNAEAFDCIYVFYGRKLYHFAFGLVKDKDAAKDIVQEVFIGLWEKRDQVNPDLNFDNYLLKITSNTVRKFFRKRSIEARLSREVFNNTPEVVENSDRELIFKELLSLANQSIEKMPPRRRTVYRLSRQEGLKIKEIAERLHISQRTAENHLAKALKFIKRELSDI